MSNPSVYARAVRPRRHFLPDWRGSLAAFFCLLPATVGACVVCDSETGEQVRAGLFNEDFWPTLLAIASPFPVLLVAIAAIHRCLQVPHSQSANEPR